MLTLIRASSLAIALALCTLGLVVGSNDASAEGKKCRTIQVKATPKKSTENKGSGGSFGSKAQAKGSTSSSQNSSGSTTKTVCDSPQGETPQERRDRLIAERDAMLKKHAAAMEQWNALATAHRQCTGTSAALPGSSNRIAADGAIKNCGNLASQPRMPRFPEIPGEPAQYIQSIIPPEVFAYSAAAELQLPEPAIQIGPDLSNIKGNMAVVGHPYWLWATGTGSMNTSASSGPLTVTLRAEAASVSFTTTDGQKISCQGAGTPFRQSVRPGTPSPDCGIKFAKRGEQRIVATVQWQIHWTAAGQTGTFTMQRTALRDIRVGELHALNTKDNPR